MLDALGRAVARHPWWVSGVWLVAAVLALATAVGGVFGQPLFDRLTSGVVAVPGDAQDGAELLDATADTGPSVLLLLDGVDPWDADVREQVVGARQDVLRIPGVHDVADPYVAPTFYDARTLPYLSDDRQALLVSVHLDLVTTREAREATTQRVEARLARVSGALPGSRALIGGVPQLIESITGQVEVDLTKGESIALPVSLVIMVLVFGGFLAAGLPLIGAISSIAGAMASLLGFSYLMDLDASTVNVVTVLGLGLCIDYGLLLVSRYREELRRVAGEAALPPTGLHREFALRRTMATAGRTVMFSGVTVAVSLTGLLLFRSNYLRAVGAAGVSIVAVALLVALTLVPALLMLAGNRIIEPGLVHKIPGLGQVARRLGDVAPPHGVFSRIAAVVQRYPVIVLYGVLAVLLAASLPVLRMHLVASGTALLPVGNEQRQLFDTMDSRFQYAASPPVIVVADARPDTVGALVQDIRELPGVTAVDPPIAQGDAERGRVTVINVRVGGTESSRVARDVVTRIRDMDPPYRIWVTGESAALLDYVDDIRARTPAAILVVVLATFLLLFLMTGSVLVPVKALFMNIVSLGASLGVLVVGFQDGGWEGWLGFTSAGGVETFIPPLTLAFGFGLAMDYEVFLLSRIGEYRRAGLPNDQAVAMGLQRSGRIITSAALIIITVFAGFVTGELLVVKETGTALTVAVAVDATLVRILLVPATMTLLGEWNWWAPGPLRRLHARFGLHDDLDPGPSPHSPPPIKQTASASLDREGSVGPLPTDPSRS